MDVTGVKEINQVKKKTQQSDRNSDLKSKDVTTNLLNDLKEKTVS